MSLQDLQKTFFQDPRWAEVEGLILKYIEPLVDMNTLDLTLDAHALKAEIIGRIKSYNSMKDFMESTRVISRPLKEVKGNFE